jgi:hypothetical protein
MRRSARCVGFDGTSSRTRPADAGEYDADWVLRLAVEHDEGIAVLESDDAP